MKMASAPTFLVTIESRSTQPDRTGTCTGVVRSRGRIGRIIASITPERAMQALTTRAAATMMMMSSENPSKACFSGTIPIAMPISSAASAIRS